MSRAERWLDDLASVLAVSQDLVARGRIEFDSDPALPLAALVGELR